MHKTIKEKVFKTIHILNYILIYLCIEGEDWSWHPCVEAREQPTEIALFLGIELESSGLGASAFTQRPSRRQNCFKIAP